MKVGMQVRGNNISRDYGITTPQRKEPMTVAYVVGKYMGVQVNDGEYMGRTYEVRVDAFDKVTGEDAETILNRMLLTQLIKEGVL